MRTSDPFRTIYAAAQAGRLLRAAGLGLVEFRPGWTEAGSKTATERAHAIWKRKLAEFEPPPLDASVAEALDDFVARRTAAGGASPMD